MGALPARSRLFRSALVIFVVVAVIFGACGGAAPQTTTPAGQAPGAQSSALDTACAEGAKEGKVVYAGGFTPEPFDRIIAPFKAKYPGINVELFAGTTEDNIQKILTESGANRLSIDAVQFGFELQTLKDRGLLILDAEWAKMGIAPNLLGNSFGAVRIFRLLRGLAYNTTKIKPEELPTTWEGLIDPKWNGKVTTDPRALGVGVLVLAWGNDKAAEWVRNFSRTTKPALVESLTGRLTSVASGEFLFTTEARDAEVAGLKAKGAPIAMHYLDLIPVTDSFQALLKGAPHPNAAKCFIAWMASSEAQAKLFEVDFKSNVDLPANAPKTAKLLIAETAEQLAQVSNAQKALQRIYTTP
jgi:iron(III) transport system substrate-binding protein